jgi:tRNA nucleotidyltransferase/poly(A) polymerase
MLVQLKSGWLNLLKGKRRAVRRECEASIVVLSTACKILKKHPVMKSVYRVSQEVGTPIYLVGGAVRDVLMGIAPEKDFDFVMGNNLIKSARLFSRIFEGSFFPLSSDPPNYRVVLLHTNQRIEVDFSGFRGDDLCHDLTNRDFTVNAIALEVGDLYREGEIKLYDPLGGEHDLQTRVLRLASPCAFDQDPLRILRAVRIAKERNLHIDTETREAIYRQRNRLCSVSAERIRSEFFKILSFSDAPESLKLLDELGLLSILIPETEALKEKSLDPSGLSLWQHSLEVVSWCEWSLVNLEKIFPHSPEYIKSYLEEKLEEDVDRKSLLKLAGFLHDRGEVFPGAKAMTVADNIARRLKLGKQTGRTLRKMVKYYNQALSLRKMEKPPSRVFFQFFQNVDSEGLAVLLLAWAEYIACAPERFTRPEDIALRNFLGDLVHYYVNEYPLIKPLLSGQEIIERFGLQEGKVVGELLNQVACAEAQGLLASSREAVLFIEDLLSHKRKHR